MIENSISAFPTTDENSIFDILVESSDIKEKYIIENFIEIKSNLEMHHLQKLIQEVGNFNSFITIKDTESTL